jgi:pimeloyl-ACP methyl ester carboxylesterase
VPLRQAERLQALLPEVVLQVIPGTGHQPMEENPAEFNRLLLEWLES